MNKSTQINTRETPSKKTHISYVIVLAAFIFVTDIITKIWAYYQLRGNQPIEVIPGFFRFAYAENTGIAFSLFQDQSGLLNILIPIAFIILLILIFKMFKSGAVDTWYLTFFGLIIGGSLGNILNRMYNGFVVDFFDAYIGQYHWPTFNVADSALTVGAVILAIKLLFESEPAPQKSETTDTLHSKETEKLATESETKTDSVSS